LVASIIQYRPFSCSTGASACKASPLALSRSRSRPRPPRAGSIRVATRAVRASQGLTRSRRRMSATSYVPGHIAPERERRRRRRSRQRGCRPPRSGNPGAGRRCRRAGRLLGGAQFKRIGTTDAAHAVYDQRSSQARAATHHRPVTTSPPRDGPPHHAAREALCKPRSIRSARPRPHPGCARPRARRRRDEQAAVDQRLPELDLFSNRAVADGDDQVLADRLHVAPGAGDQDHLGAGGPQLRIGNAKMAREGIKVDSCQSCSPV